MPTPNLSLVLPTVGTTLGPQWANLINEALELIDSHDHTSGKGIRITPNAININTDLGFNGHRITNVKMLVLSNSVADPTGSSEVRSVFSKNGDAYWNNGSGIAVKLTDGNRVNVGPITGTNSFVYKQIASNLTITSADNFNYVEVTTTTIPRTMNLPAASSVAGGRYYIFKDVNGQASTGTIRVVPNGSDTIDGFNSTVVMNGDFDAYGFVSNGTGSYRTFVLNDGKLARGDISRPLQNIRIHGTLTGNPAFGDPLRLGTSIATVDTSSITLTASEASTQVLIAKSTDLGSSIPSDINITVPGQVGWSKLVQNQVSSSTEYYAVKLALSGTTIQLPEDTSAMFWTAGTAGAVQLRGGFNKRLQPPTANVWHRFHFDDAAGAVVAKNSGPSGLDLQVRSGSTDFGYVGIHRLAARFIANPSTCLAITASQSSSIGQFRLSAWIKPVVNVDTTDTTSANQRLIVARYLSTSNPELCYALGLCKSGSAHGSLFLSGAIRPPGGPVKYLISPDPVIPNQWNHIGMTYDMSTARLFLNGNDVVRTAAPGDGNNLVSTGDWVVGSHGARGTYGTFAYEGYIDELLFEPASGSGVALTAFSPASTNPAKRWFADVWRRGMGFWDDIGAFGE